MTRIEQIDALIAPGRFDPRWGWHDDHRERDGTLGYLPALMQVRSEFSGLLDALAGRQLPAAAGSIFDGRCLQLGVGECAASHEVWKSLFAGGAVTLDFNGFYVDDRAPERGGDTHTTASRLRVNAKGPYDFLFVDAGHSYDDVHLDYLDYSPMIRRGGVIAFHDSLARAAYPEVKVWKYLEHFVDRKQIGDEVGIAWVVKE